MALLRIAGFGIELFGWYADGQFRLCRVHEGHERQHPRVDEPGENREGDDQSGQCGHQIDFASWLSMFHNLATETLMN